MNTLTLIPNLPEHTDFNLKQATIAFLTKQTGIFGNYYALPNAIVYRNLCLNIRNPNFKEDILCLRITKDKSETIFGNSSRLQAEATWGESRSQALLRQLNIPMLPFESFTEAGLKLTSLEIIDQSGHETVKRHNPNKDKYDKNNKLISKHFENTHFTGASLFKISNKYFLFDIDRAEIAHGIFNPFITELPKAVSTIKEAYDSLIPESVKLALKEGQKIKRQGEYFFIKQKISVSPTMRTRFGGTSDYLPGVLQAQGNRAHICSLFNKESGLVSGQVTHQGREHQDLDLSDGWYMPVSNTAVKSFTLTGDVD